MDEQKLTQVGEELLKELNAEIVKADESKKMLEGALQGIRMYHQRLLDAEKVEEESVEDSESSGDEA